MKQARETGHRARSTWCFEVSYHLPDHFTVPPDPGSQNRTHCARNRVATIARSSRIMPIPTTRSGDHFSGLYGSPGRRDASE